MGLFLVKTLKRDYVNIKPVPADRQVHPHIVVVRCRSPNGFRDDNLSPNT